MSIYLFTGCVFAAFAFVAFLGSTLKDALHGRRTFLLALLERLRDLLAVGFCVSLALCAVLLVLQLYYWNGATVGELDALDGARGWIATTLDEWLPASWITATLALALIFAMALFETGNGIATALARFFLGSQSWAGRLSVVAAVLASFTFLTSSSSAVRSWVDFELADAREAAQGIDASAQELAISGAVDDLLVVAMDALDGETKEAFVKTQDALFSLADEIDIEGPSASNAAARTFLDAEYRAPSAPAEPEVRPAASTPDLTAYEALSPEQLREARERLEELRKSPLQRESPVEVRARVRGVFAEAAVKAVVDRTFSLRGSATGNPLADLLIEAVGEAAVERARESLRPRIEAIKAAVGAAASGAGAEVRDRVAEATRSIGLGEMFARGVYRGPTQTLASLGERAGALLQAAIDGQGLASAPPAPVEAAPAPEPIAAEPVPVEPIPATPEPAEPAVPEAVTAESAGDPPGTGDGEGQSCPEGQVLLQCSRGGVPFCGSPAQDGSPC